MPGPHLSLVQATAPAIEQNCPGEARMTANSWARGGQQSTLLTSLPSSARIFRTRSEGQSLIPCLDSSGQVSSPEWVVLGAGPWSCGKVGVLRRRGICTPGGPFGEKGLNTESVTQREEAGAGLGISYQGPS